MTVHHSPLPAHLVRHEVNFRGPNAAQAYDLPESQQGHVSHVFVNESIYPQIFSTTASTTLAALRVIGPASPPPVTVLCATKKMLWAIPRKGTASQVLEHQARTGIILPYTATARFLTTATGPWGTPSPLASPPTISITLKP
jgi:hypothetical protein